MQPHKTLSVRERLVPACLKVGDDVVVLQLTSPRWIACCARRARCYRTAVHRQNQIGKKGRHVKSPDLDT